MHDFHATLMALATALRHRQWSLVTAESCTGGLIAAACTDLAGSSDWFDCGFVTYSNHAKTELLGVTPLTLTSEGAVSEAVARAMALGALQRSQADLAVAVTGIAGPSGATPGKPVGTVCLAQACRHGDVHSFRLQLPGDRHEVRRQTVDVALRWLLQAAVTGHAVSAPSGPGQNQHRHINDAGL